MIEKNPDPRWWTKTGYALLQSFNSVVNILIQSQRARLARYVDYQRLYGGTAWDLVSPVNVLPGLIPSTDRTNADRERVSENVIKRCVDTFVSKMSKNRPKPYFVTNGADSAIYSGAAKRNKFIDGFFNGAEAYTVAPLAVRNATIFGTGVQHEYVDEGGIKIENVLPHEIFVDEIEGMYGNPRSLFRVKAVDRQKLIDLYPEKAALIKTTNSITWGSGKNQNVISDMIFVRCGWHLKSSSDSKDGKYVVAIDNAILEESEFNRKYFPFAFLHYSPPVLGFWGNSPIAEVAGLQLQLNKIMWLIQKTLHIGGTVKIWLEASSKIVKEHMNNSVGPIAYYSGTPPQYITPPLVQPEFYQEKERLVKAIYEQFGLSALSVVSQKPSGLNSAPAQREFNYIESDRFNSFGRAYEDLFMQLGRIGIEIADELVSNGSQVKVDVINRGMLEQIEWEPLDLSEAQYSLQSAPVSNLPNEPQGRLEAIQEYIKLGWIDGREGRRMMNLMDLEKSDSLAAAAEDWITKTLDGIVEKGEYVPPESMDNIALAKTLTLQYYQRAKCMNIDAERIDLLRNYMMQLDELEKKMMMQNQPMLPQQQQQLPAQMPEQPMMA